MAMGGGDEGARGATYGEEVGSALRGKLHRLRLLSAGMLFFSTVDSAPEGLS